MLAALLLQGAVEGAPEHKRSLTPCVRTGAASKRLAERRANSMLMDACLYMQQQALASAQKQGRARIVCKYDITVRVRYTS